jgi:predicted AAA+ superfamily ATPase
MIYRSIEKDLIQRLFKGKAIVIMGARQVGKTTLLKKLFADGNDILWLNGDQSATRALFENISLTSIRPIIGNSRILIIDEAQRIRDIGIKLKIIIDGMPKLQVIATGSSSFDLANKINEPLTGRKWEYHLFPLSFNELANTTNVLEEIHSLPQRLVFGSYPEVINNVNDEQKTLVELTDSYLYKDILEFDSIHKPDKLVNLLQALAYQIGSEVSYTELSQLTGIDVKTVDKYITILEQAYIVFRLRSFSRNLRNELKNSRKIYFYDNGIRNAVIRDFSPAEVRGDVGALFENYIISERIKHKHYTNDYSISRFWRTSTQQEIDYIEEKDGKINAFEIKWNPNRKAKLPLSFKNAYPLASFNIINRNNFYEYLI